MAHVDREVRQQVIDRQTTVVPLKHAAHRKCVPQPMNARPGVAATVLNTGQRREADKGLPNGAVTQVRTYRRDKKASDRSSQ